jgi:hypothetical protein
LLDRKNSDLGRLQDRRDFAKRKEVEANDVLVKRSNSENLEAVNTCGKMKRLFEGLKGRGFFKVFKSYTDWQKRVYENF